MISPVLSLKKDDRKYWFTFYNWYIGIMGTLLLMYKIEIICLFKRDQHILQKIAIQEHNMEWLITKTCNCWTSLFRLCYERQLIFRSNHYSKSKSVFSIYVFSHNEKIQHNSKHINYTRKCKLYRHWEMSLNHYH